jgi:hypothetical protein
MLGYQVPWLTDHIIFNECNQWNLLKCIMCIFCTLLRERERSWQLNTLNCCYFCHSMMIQWTMTQSWAVQEPCSGWSLESYTSIWDTSLSPDLHIQVSVPCLTNSIIFNADVFKQLNSPPYSMLGCWLKFQYVYIVHIHAPNFLDEHEQSTLLKIVQTKQGKNLGMHEVDRSSALQICSQLLQLIPTLAINFKFKSIWSYRKQGPGVEHL